MAQVTYTQQINETALRQLLTGPAGGVYRDIVRRGLLVETQAKRNLAGGPSGPTRIDTGRLRSSIRSIVVMRNGIPTAIIGTDVFYARFVHDGTGVYGPRRRPIRPTHSKRLRFRPKGQSRYVYAKQVRGMVANHFLRDALKAARN